MDGTVPVPGGGVAVGLSSMALLQMHVLSPLSFAQRDPVRSPRQKQLGSARFCYGSDADLESTRRGDLTEIPALSAVMVPLPLLLLERVVVVD